ncbi:MAG: sn-glycerol-3-phosphate ABC transporter ATP-binding protein UgpC [Thermoanaerobaculia bacterium]
MTDVRFDGVVKRYGTTTVIDDLNLEVRDHEMMVLVGPSGCGKSTALRMIAGLEEISEGSIFIGGHRVNDLPPKDRDIAMVFQTYALYPHMTVRENLEFGLRMRKMPAAEREERVGEAAAILEIAELLDRRPKELSGGQRQRVAVGRAIVRHPAVFLFDEPLSNLDAKLRVQMRAEITRIQKRLQTTSVYVTHDQVEAMTMGDRIAVMNQGRIEQLGTPIEVYERPANLFVAQFIGTPPMSFFRATLSNGVLKAATFTLPVSAGEAADGEVVVGIRPEHVHESNAAVRGTTAVVSAVVELVEQLGHAIIVHARAGEDRIAAVFDPHLRPRVGEAIDLKVETGRVHLFPPGDGRP